ncbi:MAG: hypothetical protein ABSC73_02810 [Acidimicrobiales bacterium]|jgi:hypothetical protein
MFSRNSNSRRGRSGLAIGSLVVLGALAIGTPAPSAFGVSARSSTATAAIKANWTTFFKGTTPAAKKETLLQNGKAFAAFLAAQAKTAQARSTTVKVTKVKLTSKTGARVTYTIYLGGTPVEPNAVGTALLQDKVWKVSDASFCALVSLEGAAPKACSKY